MFYYLLEQVRDHLLNKATGEMVRLIDSTTIDLNLNQYEWAKFRSAKEGIKFHAVYDLNADIPVMRKIMIAKRSGIYQSCRVSPIWLIEIMTTIVGITH